MIEILQYLKSIGCNFNVKVNEYAPLHTACRFGSNASINFLLGECTIDKYALGLEPQLIGQAGTQAHHFCAHDGNLDMLKLLIEY